MGSTAAVVMMTYNPRRYLALLDGAGYRKAKDMVAYFLDNPEPPERMVRAAGAGPAPRGGRSSIDMKHFDRDVRKVREVTTAPGSGTGASFR